MDVEKTSIYGSQFKQYLESTVDPLNLHHRLY